jgi:hypothetical protein
MPSPALILLWSTSAAAAAAPGLPQQRVWDIAAPPGSPDDHLPAVTAEMVAEINAGQSSWEAHVPDGNMTRGAVRRLCGSSISSPHNQESELFRPVSEDYIATKLRNGVPAAFDARTNWPQCLPIIGKVRNQGAGCGDCWAYGATQALQDRYCIATGHNDSTRNLLSTEDTLACMDQFIGTPGQGCAGGDPQNAMICARKTRHASAPSATACAHPSWCWPWPCCCCCCCCCCGLADGRTMLPMLTQICGSTVS